MSVILDSYNVFGCVPSHSVSWKSLRSIVIILCKGLVEFGIESIRSWAFLIWEDSLLLLQSHCLLSFYLSGLYPLYSILVSQMNQEFSLFEYGFSNYSLTILWISLVFVVISPFSCLILLIGIFSLLLLRLAKGLSILFISSKNQLFGFFDSWYRFSVSV
jgi:hypothetical protein